MKRFAVISMFVILCATATYAQAAKPASAREIMDRVAALYATCDSYLDDGQVTSVFSDGNQRTIIKTFSTAFVRPGEFRFEFQQRHGLAHFRGEEFADASLGWDSFIAWRHGDLVQSWVPLKEPYEAQNPTLHFALGGMAGISDTASVLIPQLLMPDELGAISLLLTLTEPKLSGEERVAGRETYKIEGKSQRDSAVSVWIDKQTQLILKARQRNNFKTFSVEHVFAYHPQMNIKIPADRLAFNRPKGNRGVYP